MGARGNSGVILSQLFRGFCKNIETENEINAQQLASSFQAGVDTAYKAVMKPVEGTILTVKQRCCKKLRLIKPKKQMTALKLWNIQLRS